MADRLLQSNLNAPFPDQFVVESAGTGALAGNQIDPQITDFIGELGVRLEFLPLVSQKTQILEGQDLALTPNREHRSQVVEITPVTPTKVHAAGVRPPPSYYSTPSTSQTASVLRYTSYYVLDRPKSGQRRMMMLLIHANKIAKYTNECKLTSTSPFIISSII